MGRVLFRSGCGLIVHVALRTHEVESLTEPQLLSHFHFEQEVFSSHQIFLVFGNARAIIILFMLLGYMLTSVRV